MKKLLTALPGSRPSFRGWQTFWVCALLMGAIALTGCSKGESAPFSSETGQFTINAPETFQETQQSVETPIGTIDIHTFTAEKRKSAYVVAYSDYPPQVVTLSDPQLLLDSSRDGALRNLKGNLVKEEKIELNGNPGRSLIINATTETGEPATINARLYLVKNRLYQVLVVIPEKNADLSKTQAFLDSFTLQ